MTETDKPADELAVRDDLPERIWTWQNHPGAGFWRGTQPRYGEQRHDYVRADLVAAKDQEIEALAEAALRDVREISRLRELLRKFSSGREHSLDCPLPMDWPAPCTCGHDAVAAYFREVKE